MIFMKLKGWFVGKNKMKDWKAAVRTWEQKENLVTKKYSRPDVKPELVGRIYSRTRRQLKMLHKKSEKEEKELFDFLTDSILTLKLYIINYPTDLL